MAVIAGPGYIMCGLDKGETHKYKCSFCDYESNNIDNFATSMCWECVYGPDIAPNKEENAK